jgi:glycerol-3-phosphate dehydrogenase
MNRDLATLARDQFDALIIGGGIFGAGIARDAAMRGLRVALVEKSDFASGTSSRSSKLIHGGLRYLEQRKFRLVFEACRERQILQRIAPQLVRPLPFLFPVFGNNQRSFAKIRIGVTLYDFLALGRNIAPHQTLSAERARQMEPALAPTGLRGAVLYHDCQADDARLCIKNLVDAAQRGAVCANYCEVIGLADGKARLIDRLRDETFEIAARVFVNAAGAWVGHIAALAGQRGVALSPTKGIHLLVPKLTQHQALAFQARRDGRILFVLPWNDCSLIGTTDTEWQGDARNARAEAEDVEYLLDEVNELLPERSIRPSDIITSFAGVRALLSSDNSPGRRTREHLVVQQGNVIHVLGGKYTTYRLIAEQVVDQFSNAPCRTAETPLLQDRPPPAGECVASHVFASHIAHACEHEMAQSVSDVMWRRTGLALSRAGGADTARIVSRLMANSMKWTDERMNSSLQEYLNDRDRASRF